MKSLAKGKVTIRIILDVILFFAVLKGWWFVALPFGIIGAWFFPYYLELIVAGIIYDSLFGMIPETGLWRYAGTIISTSAFVIMIPLRRIIRRHKK